MPSQAAINTPLSGGVTREAVIAQLHNHEKYIKTTCPDLIDYHHVSGTAGLGSPCVYEVTDKRPIGQTTYKLDLVNHEDGIVATVNGKSPTGAMTIESKWIVYADKIEEIVNIDSNFVMNKMIKGTIEKNHPQQHQGFLQAV